MNHPFLLDPERARAYRILCDHPSGSTRSWADQTGWTHKRMRGFLDSLVKEGLGEVRSLGKRGSVFVPCPTVPDRALPCPTVPSDSEAPFYPRARTDVLDNTGLTASRCALAREDVENRDVAEMCITAANEPFVGLAEHWPISLDHIGSHKTVDGWLALGIPAEAVVRFTAARARTWNMGKTGGPPRSLGAPWFKNGVPADWRHDQVEARKQQLSLMFLTTIERKVAVPATEAEPEKPLEEGSPPTPPQPISGEAQEAWRVAFQTAQPGTRLEIA